MLASLELFDQNMYFWDTSPCAFLKLEHVVFCLLLLSKAFWRDKNLNCNRFVLNYPNK